jgi:anti-sigma regulatory factor (Ser/Thr protein kinase)
MFTSHAGSGPRRQAECLSTTAMDQRLVLRVAGSDEGVRLAAETFDRFRTAHGVPFTAAWKLQVALDEVLSNVVRYAYAGRARADIELEYGFRRGIVTVVVIDSGPRFNPLDVPPPRTDLPIDERPPGGLGIAFIRSLTDEARYEWRDGKNVLTMALHVQA